MDVIGGLSAARLALDLAKDLREIDKSVDEAAYKMKVAELMSALADTQVACAEAKSRINELETELNQVKNGASCPKCLIGHLKVVDVQESTSATVEFHLCHCAREECDYETKRLFDARHR